MTTQTQKQAILAVLDILMEAISTAGERGIPSGHLYAILMGKMTLSQYQSLIGILVKSGKVKDSGHLLTAIKA